MDEQTYITNRINRTVLRSLMLLLEDMRARSGREEETTDDRELTSALRNSEASRLIEECRLLLSLPLCTVSDAYIAGDTCTENQREIVPHADTGVSLGVESRSRIKQKIASGEMKVKTTHGETQEILSCGTLNIEVSENDEVTETSAHRVSP